MLLAILRQERGALGRVGDRIAGLGDRSRLVTQRGGDLLRVAALDRGQQRRGGFLGRGVRRVLGTAGAASKAPTSAAKPAVSKPTATAARPDVQKPAARPAPSGGGSSAFSGAGNGNAERAASQRGKTSTASSGTRASSGGAARTGGRAR